MKLDSRGRFARMFCMARADDFVSSAGVTVVFVSAHQHPPALPVIFFFAVCFAPLVPWYFLRYLSDIVTDEAQGARKQPRERQRDKEFLLPTTNDQDKKGICSTLNVSDYRPTHHGTLHFG